MLFRTLAALLLFASAAGAQSLPSPQLGSGTTVQGDANSQLFIKNTGGAANTSVSSLYTDAMKFQLRFNADVTTTSTPFFEAQRSGAATSSVTVTAPIINLTAPTTQINGDATQSQVSVAHYKTTITGAPNNQHSADIYSDANGTAFRLLSDSGSAYPWLSVTRSGVSSTVVAIKAPTVALTGIVTRSVSTGVTPTGTNISGAVQLQSVYNEVTTTNAVDNGVSLPETPVGSEIVVFNRGTSELLVYPQTTALTIEGAATSALAANANARFVRTTATMWRKY